MTADELREKLMATVFIAEDEADAAIRVVIEAAADISESYEPRCDTCPRGVALAIRALLPEEQQ